MAYRGYKDEYINKGMEDMDATINGSIMTASDFVPHKLEHKPLILSNFQSVVQFFNNSCVK